jgi:hypothetical protein
MKMFYILTERPWPDEYKILGLFSTKQLAEEAQKHFPGSEIEPHYLDPLTDYKPGHQMWHVSFKDDKIFINSPLGFALYGSKPREEYFVNNNGERYYNVFCWASDTEDAAKKATEKYDFFKWVQDYPHDHSY